MNLPAWMTSSEGNGALSLRLKSLIGLVISAAVFFGLDLSSLEGEISGLVDIVLKIGSLIGAAITIIQHIFAWFRARKNKQLGKGKFADRGY